MNIFPYLNAVLKNIFTGMSNQKKYWEPYRPNWRSLKVGDWVITENLEFTGGIVQGIIEAGEFRKWRVIESKPTYKVAICDGQRMVFCDDFIDENDIHEINRMFLARMKLKHYVYRNEGKSLFDI